MGTNGLMIICFGVAVVLVVLVFIILGPSVVTSITQQPKVSSEILAKAEKLAMLEISETVVRKGEWSSYFTYVGMIIETKRRNLMLAVTPEGKVSLYQISFSWRNNVPSREWNLV